MSCVRASGRGEGVWACEWGVIVNAGTVNRVALESAIRRFIRELMIQVLANSRLLLVNLEKMGFSQKLVFSTILNGIQGV